MNERSRAGLYGAIGLVLGFTLAGALFFRPGGPRSENAPKTATLTPDLKAAGEAASRQGPMSPPNIRFERAAFNDLPGWARADVRSALGALRRSCAVVARRADEEAFASRTDVAMVRRFYGPIAPWRSACAALPDTSSATPGDVRSVMETLFEPYRVIDESGRTEGLFTGYYEPELEGALRRSADHPWPALKPPRDLVTVSLKTFDEDLPSRRLRGEIGTDGRLIPYPDRGAIERRAVEEADVLVWLKDRADLFFLHIQGSGRVRLPDGTVMRIGYAADNGRAYRSIGRALIRRGALAPHQAGLDAIKAWLRQADPEAAAAIYAENPSFIFFEERRIEDPALGPLGAMGVSLTPEVSFAVDPQFHAYGAPVWFTTKRPRADGSGGLDDWAGLAVMQDTGSAIRGAIRADVFFGWGETAERRAARMKHPGAFWVLRPKAAAPLDAAAAPPA